MRMDFEEASAILFSEELCTDCLKDGSCTKDCADCDLYVTQAELDEAREVMANTNM